MQRLPGGDVKAVSGVVAYLRERQLRGDCYGWSVLGPKEVEVFLPLDVDPDSFPNEVGETHLSLVQLPKPEEQQNARCQ